MVVAGWAAVAAAAAEPLLVVVEAAPEVDADAGEIRRAVSAELNVPAIGPLASAGEGAERALIVGVDRTRIAVALRDRSASPVVRVIPSPAERAARVRAVAWLAGNLVRDQVSEIVAGASDTKSLLADMPSLAQPDAHDAAPEIGAPLERVQPPAFEAPAATLAAAPALGPPEPPRWSFSVEAGPVTGFYSVWERKWTPYRSLGTLWRVDGRRFSADRRFFVGGSLEGVTGSPDSEVAGAAGLCGWVRRRGPWAFETIVGAGLDVARREWLLMETATATSPAPGAFVSSMTVTHSLAGGAYGTAAVALSRAIGAAGALFLRVGAHVSTVDESDLFVSTTLGVSYGL
ncbi:MAG TPA: hypothetical protein VHO67_09995 [Polyangia bacterium]|nr:hypothetical protein [Polyangia bacterium]